MRIKYCSIKKYFHRLDGPAVEAADGTKAWYLYGRWAPSPKGDHNYKTLSYKNPLLLIAYFKHHADHKNKLGR